MTLGLRPNPSPREKSGTAHGRSPALSGGRTGRRPSVRWAGRRAVTLADQVLSSASNVLAVVLVARVLPADGFGRFTLGYALLTLTLTLSRSFLGTRISLATDRRTARRLTREALGAVVVLLPVLPLLVFAGSAVLTEGRSLDVLAVVALATPVVCAQDLIRFGAAAAGRPWSAFWSDALWLLVMAVPLLPGVRLGASAVLGLWLTAAVGAMLLASLLFGVRPDVRRGWAYLVRRDDLSTSVTVGALLALLGSLWIMSLAARTLGAEAAGALRGAATVLGPLNVLIAFSSLALTPLLARRPRRADHLVGGAVAVTLGVGALAWGGLLLLVPARLGDAVMGESWAGIARVLPWTTLEVAAWSVAAGAMLGIKVRGLSRALVLQRSAYGALVFGGGTAVTLLADDVRAVAVLLTVAAWIGAGVLWWRLLISPATSPE